MVKHDIDYTRQYFVRIGTLRVPVAVEEIHHVAANGYEFSMPRVTDPTTGNTIEAEHVGCYEYGFTIFHPSTGNPLLYVWTV